MQLRRRAGRGSPCSCPSGMPSPGWSKQSNRFVARPKRIGSWSPSTTAPGIAAAICSRNSRQATTGSGSWRPRPASRALSPRSISGLPPCVGRCWPGWMRMTSRCRRGWPEDWDLFLRAFACGLRLRRVPEVLLRWRLHAGQLTRTDPRHDTRRLLAARADHLSRHLRDLGTRGHRWILGAGPIGKRLAKALAGENAEIAGFVDVDPKKIGGLVHDGSQRWPVISSSELLARRPRPFAIAA